MRLPAHLQSVSARDSSSEILQHFSACKYHESNTANSLEIKFLDIHFEADYDFFFGFNFELLFIIKIKIVFLSVRFHCHLERRATYRIRHFFGGCNFLLDFHRIHLFVTTCGL